MRAAGFGIARAVIACDMRLGRYWYADKMAIYGYNFVIYMEISAKVYIQIMQLLFSVSISLARYWTPLIQRRGACFSSTVYNAIS